MVISWPLMFSDDDKRYVRRGDPDNAFKDGEAVWTNCACCGETLLIPPDWEPFCGGTISSCLRYFN